MSFHGASSARLSTNSVSHETVPLTLTLTLVFFICMILPTKQAINSPFLFIYLILLLLVVGDSSGERLLLLLMTVKDM